MLYYCKTECPYAKEWVGSLPYILYTNINKKWIKGLNVRPETIKFLEGNIRQKLHDTGFVNDFLDMTPTKEKKRQIGLH